MGCGIFQLGLLKALRTDCIERQIRTLFYGYSAAQNKRVIARADSQFSAQFVITRHSLSTPPAVLNQKIRQAAPLTA